MINKFKEKIKRDPEDAMVDCALWGCGLLTVGFIAVCAVIIIVATLVTRSGC